MVVCKCRKATKLYCFAHKVPVCGECICFPEHQICVVRTYPEWVIDAEYDWPPNCCSCQAVLGAENDSITTRLGCLHVMHTSCLLSHIKSFPPHTAPAGYVCPACSSPMWPPKSLKDSGSRLHAKLREVIVETGMEKNVLGNHLFLVPPAEPRAPPPAFSSDPLVNADTAEGKDRCSANLCPSMKDPNLASASAGKEGGYLHEGNSGAKLTSPDIVEIDGPSSVGNQFTSDPEPHYMRSVSRTGIGATTRKGLYIVDRQNSEISYYADDGGNQKKYTRRSPFRHKFLRLLLPFWSNALPTLPLTAPPHKDGTTTDNVPEGRLRHQRSSRMDPRKILLVMALMACMATMGILYYRLAQRSLIDNRPEDERQ